MAKRSGPFYIRYVTTGGALVTDDAGINTEGIEGRAAAASIENYKAKRWRTGGPEIPQLEVQPMMSKLTLVVAVAAAAAAFSEAFMLPPAQDVNGRVSTSLNIFGGLKGAFANDESLGARENAGLKNGPKMNDQVSGRKVSPATHRKT